MFNKLTYLLTYSSANHESANLNNSQPDSPAADGTGLEQRDRLESNISHTSGNNDHLLVISSLVFYVFIAAVFKFISLYLRVLKGKENV